MIANKILNIILNSLSIVVVPIMFISTLILGLLVIMTFGLLLFPLSLIWSILFLFPLVGISYVYEKVPILRIPSVIIGIPIAIIGNTYASLIPSMGETESRITKLLITESFPFSWHLFQLNLNNSLIQYTNGFSSLIIFLNKIKLSDEARWNFATELKIKNNIE